MNVSAVEILLFIAGYSEKLKGGICNDSLILDEFNNWAWFNFISWFETHWSSRIRILINTRINMKLVFDDFESRTWYQITKCNWIFSTWYADLLGLWFQFTKWKIQDSQKMKDQEMRDMMWQSGNKHSWHSGHDRYDIFLLQYGFSLFGIGIGYLICSHSS